MWDSGLHRVIRKLRDGRVSGHGSRSNHQPGAQGPLRSSSELVRACLVKLVALALVGLELACLHGSARVLAVALTLAATAAFFAWVIAMPSAQFLVPSVHRLEHEDGVAFTFDDGPDPAFTPRILEVLAEHGARATFFVVGCRAEQHPELVKRIVAEGHAVGSHSYSHAHTFHFGSPARQRADVERGIAALHAVTGTPPRLFRPPQGLRTPLLRDALAAHPELVCVTWTERGLDAMGRAASRIVARLRPAVRAGAILTLHDGTGFGGAKDRSPTVAALRELLALARERGLRCVSLAALETSQPAPGRAGSARTRESGSAG